MENLKDICTEYIFGEREIYYETLMFVAEKNGGFIPVKTLFQPEKIISVLSSSLEYAYEKNIDYVFTDEGMMPSAKTSMPYFEYDRYYLESDEHMRSFPMEKGHLVFGEGAYFHTRQICVSYTRKEKGPEFDIPEKSSRLPKIHGKIKKQKKLNILFNGDSITTGANSSGMKEINVKPYLPAFPELFTYKIEKTYGIKTNLVNIAEGGTNAAWGIDQSKKYLEKDGGILPDLYVIAFGMNDASGKVPVCDYISNIKKIIIEARTICPDCEFILISTMLPNPVLPGFAGPHADYENPLLSLEDEFSGLAVANMTKTHRFLLKKKRYFDMTGNNVNHPNDFLARIYAQTLLKTLGVYN